MSYFKELGLSKEPFSTSPDPAFFYRSQDHDSALKRLASSLKLRRGLSLILGDVGTGKTTLGRTLVQEFAGNDTMDFHLILNPVFQSEFQFLEHLCKLFSVVLPFRSSMDYLEALQNHLFQKAAQEGRTVVLIVDEGQNLTPSLIEALRTLLNYETNEYKLLQLLILGQLEALPKFQRIRNFMDRVSMKYIINPFDEPETRALIFYRLKVAGVDPKLKLFTDEAVRAIYQTTQGYPRRTTMLCHDLLEGMVTESKKVVDVEFVYKHTLGQEEWSEQAEHGARSKTAGAD